MTGEAENAEADLNQASSDLNLALPYHNRHLQRKWEDNEQHCEQMPGYA